MRTYSCLPSVSWMAGRHLGIGEGDVRILREVGMVSRSRGLAVSRLFFVFLVGGVRVAAKTRQEGTGFKDEENTINP